MKAKQHRLHYNRKHLCKTDPRRVCHGSENKGGFHSPVARSVHVIGTQPVQRLETVHVHATCAWCGLRIETFVSVETWDTQGLWSTARLEWRRELYIIPELGLR